MASTSRPETRCPRSCEDEDEIPQCTVIIVTKSLSNWGRENVRKCAPSALKLQWSQRYKHEVTRYTWQVTRVQKCDMTSYVPTVSNCIIISIIIIYLKPVPLNTLSKLNCPTSVTPLHHIYRQHAMARCKVDVWGHPLMTVSFRKEPWTISYCTINALKLAQTYSYFCCLYWPILAKCLQISVPILMLPSLHTACWCLGGEW